MLLIQNGAGMIAMVVSVGLAFGGDPVKSPFTGEREWARNCCFCVTRDASKVALNCGLVLEIPTGKKLLAVQPRGGIATAFSPDGMLLAVGGNYSHLYLYNVQSGDVVWNLTLVGHGDTIINHLEFTSDGQFLVSSSDNGMLRIWNIKEKSAHALFCFPSRFDVYNGWKDYLRAWRALAGNQPPDHVKAFAIYDKAINQISQFALSPDGKSIAVALQTSDVLLFELATGILLKTFHTDQLFNISVAFSINGKQLAVGGGAEQYDTKRGTIEVWNVSDGKRMVICPGHRHSVLHLAFSSDGKSIASGGTIDGVRVWDVASGKQKYSLHQEEQTRSFGLAFLPDGKALLTLPDGASKPIHFWDPSTGRPLPRAR